MQNLVKLQNTLQPRTCILYLQILERVGLGKMSRVGLGKMSMVGQSESDYIFVPGLKAKKLTIAGSSVSPFLFQWENKNVALITMGSLIFRKQIGYIVK